MGFIKDVLSKSIDVYRDEILPLRGDLLKAGILKPDKQAYDQKTSLVDPWSYGSVSQGYKEKNSLIDYNKCRMIASADPIIASIIQTRLNQVAAFAVPQTDKYSIGFKISMADREAKPTPKDKVKMKEIEQFLMNTGVPENFDDTPELKRRENFEHFLRKIARDSLTFDQINFEITPRNDGLPYAFQAVDASTIKMIPDKKERVERMNGEDRDDRRGLNVSSFGTEKHFEHFKPKHPKYAQVINGVIRHEYDEWEMCFGVRNPRTDLLSYGYGYSEIEMLITTITSHMNAENYNRKFFSQGSAIKGLLTFEGNVPPDQLEAFRRQWYQQVTGVNNAWKTPIMSLGENTKLNWQSLHSSNREMEFGKWMEYCIKTICGVFQMDPIEIGFDISKNGSAQSGGAGGLGNGNQAERLDYSKDKGLRPLLTFIQCLLNDYIVSRIDPNYKFEFVGLNASNEKDDLDKAVQQVKAFKTINEIRAENDLPALKESKGPGDLILDPSWLNYIQAQQAAADAKEQAAQGLGPDGQPLQQPGEGGPEDGGDEIPPDPGHEGEEDTSEPEPDYENMSVEELEAEYKKLQPKEGANPSQKEGGPAKSGAKPSQKISKPKLAEAKPMDTKKSMVFDL